MLYDETLTLRDDSTEPGKWAPLSTRVTIGVARVVHGNTWEPLGVDGVIGLGYSWLGCHPSCAPAPLDALLSTRGLFALCLHPTNGVLELGGVDSRRHSGELHWLRLLHEGYYLIAPPRLARVGGVVLPLGARAWGMVVLDSGTPHGALLPPLIYTAIARSLASRLPRNLKVLFPKPSSTASLQWPACVQLPDAEAREILPPKGLASRFKTSRSRLFPPIELVMTDLGGRPFTLQWHSRHYLYSAKTVSRSDRAVHARPGHTWLCSGLLPSAGGGATQSGLQTTVLGSRFLQEFYTVFDRDNGTIGLAPSVQCGTLDVTPSDASPLPGREPLSAAAKTQLPWPDGRVSYERTAGLALGLMVVLARLACRCRPARCIYRSICATLDADAERRLKPRSPKRSI